MYIKTLKGQWENLCSDFYQEFDLLKLRGDSAASFNSWYSVRIHRWNSVAYSEGIILDQQNNSQLSSAILSSLGEFRFRHVDAPRQKSAWTGIIEGAFIGLFTALLIKYLLDWRLLSTILAGLVVFIMSAVSIFMLLSNSSGAIDEKLKQEYISQLEDYWPKLESVCKKFDAA